MGIEETENAEELSDLDDNEENSKDFEHDSKGQKEDLRDFTEKNILDELKDKNIQYLDTDPEVEAGQSPNYFNSAGSTPTNSIPVRNTVSESHYKNKEKVPPLDFSKIHSPSKGATVKSDKHDYVNPKKM